jgi:hypothetical protein
VFIAVLVVVLMVCGVMSVIGGLRMRLPDLIAIHFILLS